MLFFRESGDRVSIDGVDYTPAAHRYDAETGSLILRPLVPAPSLTGRVVWVDQFGNVLVDATAAIVAIC